MSYSADGIFYAENEADISKVVGALLRARDRREPVGFDTEFYGVDIGSQSCFGRARVHLLSVAVKRHPRVVLPRGYDLADPAVLSSAALDHQGFVEWLEDSEAKKVIHNAPVDIHSTSNHGVRIRGFINSLALGRFAWPERARGAGFTLDSLGTDLLGVGKPESFRELFQEDYEVQRSTFRKVEVCECGEKCGKRRTTPGHTRHTEVVETVHTRMARRPVPLQDVVPGHPLWERALRYSAQDAVLALGVYDLAYRAMEIVRDVPWLSKNTADTSPLSA